MASAISLDAQLAPPVSLHRFTVAQYRQLGELGVLTPEDNVELLEGLIVAKMNHRPIHSFIVGLLNQLFQQKLPTGWIVRCQLPVTTERSEPEPDLVILRAAHADFRQRHPAGGDCRLVIEVADTSLEKDRAKATIYRIAGVHEYWIINIVEKCIERYEFSGSQSNVRHTLIHGDSHVSLSFSQVELTLELKEVFE